MRCKICSKVTRKCSTSKAHCWKSSQHCSDCHYFGAQYNVSNSTQGTLYIDLIDTKRKELIWQGVGKGSLTAKVEQKDETIHNFVTSILSEYPPQVDSKP